MFNPSMIVMKKEKVMLLAVFMLAAGGGILAFKAKTYGNVKYCYSITEVEPPQHECTYTTTGTFTEALRDSLTYYYTPTNDLSNCGELRCPRSGLYTIE
jgi:hypothetical protein